MPIRATGPFDAKIMLVGELPHERDLDKGEPFVGGPGFELTKMLAEAGISRESCYITMVMKERVAGNRIEFLIATRKKDVTSAHVLFQGKMVVPSLVASIAELRQEILRVKPNVVCTFGNLALFALTGEWAALSWRSSIMESTLVPGVKVIPTISPAMVMRSWELRPFLVHDLKRVRANSGSNEIVRPAYNFTVRPTYEVAISTLQSLLAKAKAANASGQKLKYGMDIETRAGHISCFGISWSPLNAICIPLMCVEKPEGYWTLEEEANLVFLIYQICREVKVIGQNWNYDAQYVYRYWHFICPDVEDTMVQHHSCFSNLPKNLAFLSSMYLDDHLYWKDERTNWEEDGENTYWEYNCKDCVRTYAIHTTLCTVISAMGMEAVNNFQQQLKESVLRSMLRGVRIDEATRAQFAMKIQEETISRSEWLEAATGQELNIKSPKQMADFFYRQMGQSPVVSRKTGSITCDDEALRKVAEREPILKPIIHAVADLRSLGVFNSTFIQAPVSHDGRMRTSYSICGTETYRFSSSKDAFGLGMNLQNVPKGGEQDGLKLPNIRSMIVPDPGKTFFDIDLDSADLRIVTWESGCEWMKDHFRNHRKPYIEVMREYYHKPLMDKHTNPYEYKLFKSLCHGTNYLGKASGMASKLGLTVLDTERIQKWYLGLAPEIAKWQEDIKKQVTSRHYVENAFGYRNYFFDRIEGTIFNQAVAWIPQSTVACIINRAYVNIDHNLPEVEVLLQVHDSLAGQFDTVLGDWAMRRIIEESTIEVPYSDPLVVPVGVAHSNVSWGDCE